MEKTRLACPFCKDDLIPYSKVIKYDATRKQVIEEKVWLVCNTCCKHFRLKGLVFVELDRGTGEEVGDELITRR